MYQALYRKYRPRSFDEVVGQEVLIKTLKNSIKNKNFSHAYMFFGPRGVGKTTVSKILSRSINCLSPIDGNCCEKCDNCLASREKDCVDIIEMDAASNNGVDEIRELKNNALLVPSKLKYKVYIIDEVHMLSVGAFNALLKILEEPPKHIIFILATTDPQKVPETIISRCQCFSFKKVSISSLASRIEYICSNENISIDKEVILEISRTSDGGVRDALGMLDKLNSYSDETIKLIDFYNLNDMISKNELNMFFNNVFSKNISAVLGQINNFDNNGKNLNQVLSQFMYFLRDISVDYYLNGKKIDYEIEKINKLTNLICEKMFDIRKSSNPRVSFEMLFLGFINDLDVNNQKIISREIISTVNRTNDLQETSENFDNDIKKQALVEKDSVKSEYFEEKATLETFNLLPKNIDEIMSIRVNNTLALANKNVLLDSQQRFEKLREYAFDKNNGYLICSLLDGKLRAASTVNLIVSFEYDSIVKKNLSIIDKITKIYNELTDSNISFAFITDECWNVEKEKYICTIKSGKTYTVLDEPKEVFNDSEKNDIIQNDAVKLFGDLVEFE